MGRRSALAVTMAMLLGSVAGLTQPSPAWVLSYEGKSTNQFIHDARTPALIGALVPAKLAALVVDALDGPPDPVFVRDHRYTSASACVPHSCTSKGFFWIDTQTGVGVGARFETWVARGPATLTIGSNAVSVATVPLAAREALLAWIEDVETAPGQVDFVNGAGVSSSMDTAPFRIVRYKPPAGGPSFDCAKASTPIERAICGDWEVSGLDLQLSEVYEKGRRGLDTVPAREELRTLQRDWLKARDTDCAAAPEIVACVRRYYRQQIDVLLRWTPSR